MVDSALDSGTIVLLDATTIQCRPIRRADREALQRFHGRHSDASIYWRFFHAQPALSDAQASYFTDVDGVNRFALVALDPHDPNEIIGVARFDREPGSERAEYAAIVADAYQRHGLGRQLTRRLIDAARRQGVTVFRAYVLPENLAMITLLRHLARPEVVLFEDGVECIDVDLHGDDPLATALHPSHEQAAVILPDPAAVT